MQKIGDWVRNFFSIWKTYAVVIIAAIVPVGTFLGGEIRWRESIKYQMVTYSTLLETMAKDMERLDETDERFVLLSGKLSELMISVSKIEAHIVNQGDRVKRLEDDLDKRR